MKNIICERGKIWSLNDLPAYSICLDGACQGPKIDVINHRYSFDHHGKCLRFCTNATCLQVFYAILLGLDCSLFKTYINDTDVDTSLSVFLLKNPERVNEPLLKKLVEAVSLGDQFAGAIPLNGMTKVVEWISAPQTESISNGDYYKLSNEGLLTILESILHRIELYVNGEAKQEIDEYEHNSEFKILNNENGWVLVESNDPHVYQRLYQSGFDRIVLIRYQTDNSIAVSLAKRSDFIDDFPLEQIYKDLNNVEPGWGGSSTCGGAPRNSDGSRSKLSIEKISGIINARIKLNKQPKKRKNGV